MKRVAKRALDAIVMLVGRIQVAIVCRRAGNGTLVVLDVDNTLADAWPSFLEPYLNERIRLAGLDELPNIKGVAHDDSLAAGANVLFLSHRNPWHWPVTFGWLRRHGFAVSPWNLVLVPSPADKVRHVRRCARRGRVVFWDDLSGGHETGTITFYDDVIDAVRALGVDYRGWDEIVAITGLPLERESGTSSGEV